ncbi:unnamed protein product, partial [Symbiodinium sp. CCMP2456]
MGKAKRQARQQQRPGQLNRAYTDDDGAVHNATGGHVNATLTPASQISADGKLLPKPKKRPGATDPGQISADGKLLPKPKKMPRATIPVGLLFRDVVLLNRLRWRPLLEPAAVEGASADTGDSSAPATHPALPPVLTVREPDTPPPGKLATKSKSKTHKVTTSLTENVQARRAATGVQAPPAEARRPTCLLRRPPKVQHLAPNGPVPDAATEMVEVEVEPELSGCLGDWPSIISSHDANIMYPIDCLALCRANSSAAEDLQSLVAGAGLGVSTRNVKRVPNRLAEVASLFGEEAGAASSRRAHRQGDERPDLEERASPSAAGAAGAVVESTAAETSTLPRSAKCRRLDKTTMRRLAGMSVAELLRRAASTLDKVVTLAWHFFQAQVPKLYSRLAARSLRALMAAREIDPAGTSLCSLFAVQASRNALPIRSDEGARLKLVTYNVGGLSQVAYAELLQFLQGLPEPHRPDLVLLQETHWKEDSEFDTPGWRVIGSSTKLTLDGAIVDVINIYQKIMTTSLAPAEKGDFNTPLLPMAKRVGARASLRHATRPQDVNELSDIIADHDLLHLNSWTRFAKPTYRNGSHSSLIDHIFVRHSLGDAVSRRAGPVTWPLFKWRQGGFHLPVCVSCRLPDVRQLARSRGPRSCVLDRVTLAQVCRNPQHPQICELNEKVSGWLQSHSDASVEEVNRQLYACALEVFPGKVQHQRVVPWQAPQVGLSVRNMWLAYRTWRQTSSLHRNCVWKAWVAFTSFRKAHRAFRRATRDAKVAWLRTQVACTEQSARKGDTRALFQLASRICPKQRRKTLQLRGVQGQYSRIQSKLRSRRPLCLVSCVLLAFLRYRDALIRVLLHCKDRRPSKLRGGAIQLSLDLSQAFDRLEWPLISDSLKEAGVPSDLYHLIISWHREMYYHIKVSASSARVSVGRGVRQGCRIAPMLWALATAVLMRRTDEVLGFMWSKDSLTAYADDFHTGECVSRSEHLDRSLHRFGVFLDQLMNAHLPVNSKKSAILLRLTKGFAPAWRTFDIPIKQDFRCPTCSISFPDLRITLAVVDAPPWIPLFVLSLVLGPLPLLSRPYRAMLMRNWLIEHAPLWSSTAPCTCRALVPAVSRLISSGKRGWVNLKSLLLQIELESRHWYDVKMLLKDQALRDELRHHCPCCGQWCASPAGVKVHMSRSHGVWAELLPAVLERTVLMKRMITKPCPYCLERTFDLQTHWKRCHVIMVCCFLELYAKRNVAHSDSKSAGHSQSGESADKTSATVAAKRARRETGSQETQDVQMATEPKDPFRQWGSAQTGRGQGGKSHKGKGKTTGKGKSSHKGKGKGQARSSASVTSYAGNDWERAAEYYSLDGENTLLQQMAKLALRHERQLQALQQDTKLYFFFRPDPPASVVPLMTNIAKTWRELVEANKVQSSLRETMLRELIQEMRRRIQGFAHQTEMQEQAAKMNWIDSQGSWNYLQWNPESQAEELVPRVESRSTESLLQDLDEIEKLISGTTIRHFGSVRPFRQQYETSWVQFVLEIELRTDGDRLWKHFNALINCAVLHLLAARLRRDRPVLSGLAKSLQ